MTHTREIRRHGGIDEKVELKRCKSFKVIQLKTEDLPDIPHCDMSLCIDKGA